MKIRLCKIIPWTDFTFDNEDEISYPQCTSICKISDGFHFFYPVSKCCWTFKPIFLCYLIVNLNFWRYKTQIITFSFLNKLLTWLLWHFLYLPQYIQMSPGMFKKINGKAWTSFVYSYLWCCCFRICTLISYLYLHLYHTVNQKISIIHHKFKADMAGHISWRCWMVSGRRRCQLYK